MCRRCSICILYYFQCLSCICKLHLLMRLQFWILEEYEAIHSLPWLQASFWSGVVVPVLYCHLQHHNDTLIKTQEDFLNKIFTSHFIARVRKGLLKVCVWEGAGDRTETAIFWPPLLWPSTLCLSRSSDAQPEAQRPSSLLNDGFLYCILSASSMDPNSSGPQAPSAWCGFPYHISSITPPPTVTATVTWLLSWLSYIIVQHPLDLWNGMIDRHPAEITVMLFTGHSLPVHQSMSVSWALPCPISSAKSTHAISFDYWPLECVTSFRCITL